MCIAKEFATESDVLVKYESALFCSECNRWHGCGKRPALEPKPKLAPTTRINLEKAQVSCFAKARYTTESRAAIPAQRYGLRVYRCDVCSGFHLSSKPEFFKSE